MLVRTSQHCLIFTLAAIPTAMAQQESLSMAIGVHVFPSQGQDEVQQSKDEADVLRLGRLTARALTPLR